MLCSRCQIAAAAACLACKQPLQNPAFKTYQGASPLPFLFCSADADKDVSFTMPTLNWIGIGKFFLYFKNSTSYDEGSKKRATIAMH